jgi:serine/threonine protein kinase
VKIPKSLGRYEVVDLIGQGGMGALYRARDPRIGRYVAIKVLRRDYDTPELRDRFSREARAAGSLSHQNIVTIYDVGEEDGLPFIAMEYVRGETFADLVCLRPPLSVLRKVQLAEEVCAGLAHAHEAGIVHRDIKPANLIVGPEGTVKILDFGIAKLSATGITMPGAIMGTLNYMSPEQVNGAAVDARADIFAVGAVLYELLSHQPAFPGHVPDEVLELILNGDPTPITEYCSDLDPRLVLLVDRALEKNPDLRFQSIASVQRELANIRLNPQAPVIAPPPAPAPAQRTSSPPNRELTKRRTEHLDQHLAAAQHAFDSGDYDASIESCKQVLMLDASDERAISLIDRIHTAIDEQQTRLPESQLRREEARIRAAVDSARRRFANGEHQAALESLEALEPAANPLVAGTLEELHLALQGIEQQRRVEEEQRRVEKERVERLRRINGLLADARAALKDDRLDEVSQTLDLIREIDAAVPELASLTELLSRARAAARLKEQLDRVLGDFDEQLTQGDLPRAGELLTAAATLAPTESRVGSARVRLEQATAALAAKEAADARRREGEQKVEDAAALFEKGDLAGTEDMLKRAAELVPQHPWAAEIADRLREAIARKAAAEAAERRKQQVAELIRSSAEHLQAADDNDDLVLALREVNQALALDPENAEAPSIKAAIEQSIAARRQTARARAAISNARTRFANGKHQAAIRLLEDYQPSRPDITEALSDLRLALQQIEERRKAEQERIEREQRVFALVEEARAALRAQQFDAALVLLSKVAEIDSAAPELSRLTEQVRQEQETARRRAELERMLAALDESVTRDDLSAARDILNAATALDPADARLQVSRKRVDQAVAAREAAEARAREVEEKSAAAEALFERGELQDAMRLLTVAANLDPQHSRTVLLLERVSDAIAKQEAAEAAERLRRTIEELLAAAAEHLQSSDRHPDEALLAMQKITQALALAPDHAEAQALKTRADAALAAQREAAFVQAAIRNARSRFTNGKHQSAIQLLENLDAAIHPTVADTLKELRGALQEIQDRRRAELELAQRRQRIATLMVNARAAIEGKRFAEAIEALSLAQSLDATAADLSVLTEQALQGQSAAAAAGTRLEPRRSETSSKPDDPLAADEDQTAAHEEATRLYVPVMAADAKERADEHDRRSLTSATQNQDDGTQELTLGNSSTASGIPQAEAAGRRLPWGLIVAVGLLLLAILVALFVLSRPAGGPSTLNEDQIAERRARMARRDDHTSGVPTAHVVHGGVEAGCLAREVALDQRGRATSAQAPHETAGAVVFAVTSCLRRRGA